MELTRTRWPVIADDVDYSKVYSLIVAKAYTSLAGLILPSLSSSGGVWFTVPMVRVLR